MSGSLIGTLSAFGCFTLPCLLRPSHSGGVAGGCGGLVRLLRVCMSSFTFKWLRCQFSLAALPTVYPRFARQGLRSARAAFSDAECQVLYSQDHSAWEPGRRFCNALQRGAVRFCLEEHHEHVRRPVASCLQLRRVSVSFYGTLRTHPRYGWGLPCVRPISGYTTGTYPSRVGDIRITELP